MPPGGAHVQPDQRNGYPPTSAASGDVEQAHDDFDRVDGVIEDQQPFPTELGWPVAAA